MPKRESLGQRPKQKGNEHRKIPAKATNGCTALLRQSRCFINSSMATRMLDKTESGISFEGSNKQKMAID
jgi:hypothetical protein